MAHDASQDRALERPVRFFGSYNADDVAIPRLSLASDRSLDEPDPILRLHGADRDGNQLFDHFALVLDANDSHDLALAVDELLDSIHDPDRHAALVALRERLRQLTRHALEHDRVAGLVRALRSGESVSLADQGHTTITRTSGELIVTRWGSTVRHITNHHDAAALALSDLALPLAEPLVTPIDAEPASCSTSASFDRRWLTPINDALRDRGVDGRIEELDPDLWERFLGPLLDAIANAVATPGDRQ